MAIVRPLFPYWSVGSSRRNFGDALSELLQRLFDVEDADPRDVYLLVGSVLDAEWIAAAADKADARGGRAYFWGCGWRGSPVPADLLGRVTITAVRGPRTIAGLGLPIDLPQGDPALLLPLLYRTPRPRPRYACTLMPHCADPRLAEMVEAPRRWGADHAISPLVDDARALVQAIDTIRASRFVLAGAMHAAIVAMAYGVPFAFFADGHLDCPAKWTDLAEGIGIHPIMVRSFAEGRRAFASHARTLRLPSRTLLLDAAPLPVRPDVRRRLRQ